MIDLHEDVARKRADRRVKFGFEEKCSEGKEVHTRETGQSVTTTCLKQISRQKKKIVDVNHVLGQTAVIRHESIDRKDEHQNYRYAYVQGYRYFHGLTHLSVVRLVQAHE